MEGEAYLHGGHCSRGERQFSPFHAFGLTLETRRAPFLEAMSD
jgi:hypothetical protein